MHEAALPKLLRVGVDVGGTNTDAVLMDGNQLLNSCKVSTSQNIQDGIVSAISDVIKNARVSAADLAIVSIGTTHFTNAFVQRKDLDEVGIIRIALPAAQALPPLTDWPIEVTYSIGENIACVAGGFHYDGRVNAELDEKTIAEVARSFRSKGITAIALSALFAPVNDQMEVRAKEIIQNEHPDANLTLSSKIGRIGLLERENAGIMNASLSTLAKKTVKGFRDALDKLGISAPFFVSQNDGTLMSAQVVEKYPVLTFASGPTNSLHGATYLSGLKEAIVVDVGGTTTDIGVLSKGFPRESSIQATIGGVKTNFRMPDINSIGLGGGSVVRPQADFDVTIGPESVGYNLSSEALIFGGNTLTTTDVAVAAGYADIGNKKHVENLSKKIINATLNKMREKVEDGVDRMKTSGNAIPLIIVGGGAFLVENELKGSSEIKTVPNSGVANAIGASMAPVGGEVDKVYSFETLGREKAIESAIEAAKERAVVAGADLDTTEVIDIEELPLAYMPGGAVRLRVKVAGDLKVGSSREKHE